MASIKNNLLWIVAICLVLGKVLGESSPQWNNWWQYEGISGMEFDFCFSLCVTHCVMITL